MLMHSSGDDRQVDHPGSGNTEAFKPAAPLITPALITINLLVYLAMIIRGVPWFSPPGNALLSWGANFGPLTTSGEWWRLLTACFLHFGIIHLAFNMYILLQVGLFTELLFGKVPFLLLYLIAGIGGNVAGLFFHPLTISAGASGAIFGVYGGLLGFILIRRAVIQKGVAAGIARSAGIFLIYNLVFGLARPETDIVAHLGGLLSGFASGCLLARPLASPNA